MHPEFLKRRDRMQIIDPQLLWLSAVALGLSYLKVCAARACIGIPIAILRDFSADRGARS